MHFTFKIGVSRCVSVLNKTAISAECEFNLGELVVVCFMLARETLHLHCSPNHLWPCSGPPRARIGPGERWDRGPLNVSDDWKQWRFETHITVI